MSALEFVQFNARDDNFGVLIHDKASQRTAAVDAPETAAVVAALKERNWHLDTLLITHHHFDHVAGLQELKAQYDCTVIGPASEADRIVGLDIEVTEGDTLDLFGQPLTILDTPGHTLGHIVYHLPVQGVLFAGDTLFSLGCGKLFEGTPTQMWHSLEKIRALPPETVIYVGHDYTVENGEHALSWEPDNQALQRRLAEARICMENGDPTLPTTLSLELETNPFLRTDSSALRTQIGMQEATDLEVFTRIRELRG